MARARWGFAAGVLGIVGLFLAISPARADTGGYPNATMPCEWFPQAASGPAHTKWCRDFDWGPTPATLFAGTETIDESTTISPRGFGYRNCTDYVAYELGFDYHTVHGNAAQWKDQIPAANVTNYPTVGSVAWWGTEVDDGLGHVAVVLSVNGDATVTVGEYNFYLDGTYDTRTIPEKGADAYLHIRDQALHVPAPSPSPAASHSPLPSPRPSRSPSPTPTPTPSPTPTPTDEDARNLAAVALGDLAPGYIDFKPPEVMRPHAPQLVEARVDRAGDLATAVNKQLTSQSPGGGRIPQLQPGNLMTVTLASPDFSIQATTPPQQALAAATVAVWQWDVTALRPGSHTLRLCVSVDLSAASGTQTSSPTCTLERLIQVTTVPAVLSHGFLGRNTGWMLGGGGLVVAGMVGSAGILVRRRRAG